MRRTSAAPWSWTGRATCTPRAKTASFFRLRPGTAWRELEEPDDGRPDGAWPRAYNRVDAWAERPPASPYGGTSDGYLFRLDPKDAAGRNLGKPLNQYRIRGLVFARTASCTALAAMTTRWPACSPTILRDASYQMLGMIDVNHRPYYSWQAT